MTAVHGSGRSARRTIVVRAWTVARLEAVGV
jgi:hypothetical protein